LFKGSLRAGVTIAGIILIVGAVMDGYAEKSKPHSRDALTEIKDQEAQERAVQAFIEELKRKNAETAK
jgi:hypothetical protein